MELGRPRIQPAYMKASSAIPQRRRAWESCNGSSMKREILVAILAVSSIAALPALAGGPPANSNRAAERSYGPRGQLVYQIVKKWAPYVQESYRVGMKDWAREMGGAFSKSSLDQLQTASDARTFDAMSDALLGVSRAASPQVTTKSLGDLAADLTFVPITPCRILDTRIAGGAIAAGAVRDVDVTAITDYSFQGGEASNCSGMGAAGSFAAVAINFTSVAPAQTGYFTAYPFGTTRPVAATQVFNAGQVLSNYAVVKLDQGAAANEMSIYSERPLHLVADVVGYYITPQATGLQCIDTADTVVTVSAGATANAVAPACAAGYTQTATNCESSTWQMPFVFFSGGTCSAQNNASSSASLRASRTCCRVPGR